MTYQERILLESSELVAESRLAIYEAGDQMDPSKVEPVNNDSDNKPESVSTDNNDKQNDDKNDDHKKIPEQTPDHQTNKDDKKESSPNNNNNNQIINNKHNGQKKKSVVQIMGFKKADLNDPEKIKQLEKRIKKERDVKSAKTVLRSALTLGGLALTTLTAAPVAIVSSATILANFGLNMHGEKHNNEMDDMLVLIDKKIRTTQSEYMLETDPQKRSQLKEYLDSLQTAKTKLKVTRRG